MFAGLIALLSDQNPDRDRMKAVMQLTGGLFALVIDSMLFGILAGDTICTRAWALSLPANSLLAVELMAIFGGVASLIHTYDQEWHASRLANIGTYVVAALTMYYAQAVAITYTGTLRAAGMMPPNPTWVRLILTHRLDGAIAIYLLLLSYR